MAPSLIGGWIKANSPVIDWQVIGTGPNPFQSMPILTNPLPIRGHLLMPISIHSKPIQSQFFIPAQSSQLAKRCQVSQQRTTQSQQQFHENLPSQSDANPSQSNVNFSPIRGHWQSNLPGLAWIGMDWHQIDRLAPDWLIGTGLARALPFPRPFPRIT